MATMNGPPLKKSKLSDENEVSNEVSNVAQKKGTTGVKPAVPHEKILEALLKYDIYNEKKELKPRKDDVWYDVCSDLSAEGKLTPVNVWSMVKQDRHNLHSFYRKKKKIEDDHDDFDNEDFEHEIPAVIEIAENSEAIKDIDKEIPAENNGEEKIKQNSEKNKKLKKSLQNVTVTIKPEKWKLISPGNRKRESGRNYRSLKQGWAYIIQEALWDVLQLPCAFIFPGMSQNFDHWQADILLQGHCKECGNPFVAKCLTEPVPGAAAVFKITTSNTNGIPHCQKVSVRGVARKKMSEEAVKTKATPQELRLKLAKKLKLKPNGPVCSLVPSKKASEKIIQEGKYDDLGIKKGLKMSDSLENLKRTKLSGHIKEIGHIPFRVMYWSQPQIRAHNLIQKKLGHPIEIDSTGGTDLKVAREGAPSSEIFLTQIVSYVDDDTVPLAQMRSEKNTASYFGHFFDEWLADNATVPRSTVTDMSKALLNAACKSFNGITYSIYNEQCLKHLQGLDAIELNTHIRIDIAHLKHAISNWKCFNSDTDEGKKQKIFFTKSIGLMSTIRNFKDFEKTLVLVFKCALSTYSLPLDISECIQ